METYTYTREELAEIEAAHEELEAFRQQLAVDRALREQSTLLGVLSTSRNF